MPFDTIRTVLTARSAQKPSIAQFLAQTGRLPDVTDKIKPWHYSGWLIPYFQREETLGNCSPRYDYLLRTIENARPLPGSGFRPIIWDRF